MLKEVLRALDSGTLPLIGLIAFFVAFVLIVIRTFLMKKEDRQAAKQMPLDDDDPTRTPQTHHSHEEPLA